MAIELTKPTAMINGVDFSGYVSAIRVEVETADPEPERPIRIRFQTSLDFYRWAFGRNHPRIRRMHAAYRQRRRKW